MKNKEDILRRAVCLLTFADRCVIEEKVTNGVRHSLKEREQQRKEILEWLNDNDYYTYLTPKEKNALETQIKNKMNKEIYNQENDYECIEPLLWCIGLTDKLHNYDEFVLDDLHAPLEIGSDHSFNELLKRCKEVQDDILKIHREIAMLWYWRCIESERNSLKTMNYFNAIKSIFGDDYIILLEKYESFDVTQGDFVVKGKTVAELNESEIAKLSVIAERRFYAFEWLCTDDDWENVDLVC